MEWGYFDAIKCINLLERNDRFEQAKEVFKKYQIPATFHRVQRHPNGGVNGCYESHIQIITEAYNSGASNVLIFEDDIEPGVGLKEKQISSAIDFMKSNDSWDIVFLGWHPRIMTHTTSLVAPSMFKVSAFGGHAYVVSRRMMAKLANRPFDGTPIDVIYAENDAAYGVYPTAFVQRGARSDLVSNFSSSKSMKPVRAFMECWSVNVNYPVNSLAKALGIWIAAVVVSRLLLKRWTEVQIASLIVLLVVLLVVCK
jgi:hypothetical protein